MWKTLRIKSFEAHGRGTRIVCFDIREIRPEHWNKEKLLSHIDDIMTQTVKDDLDLQKIEIEFIPE